MDDKIRINKYISDAGICSRRQADELILKGSVRINGAIAMTGSKVGSEDVVTVGGKTIKRDTDLVIIKYNKPRGVECTASQKVKNNIIKAINYDKQLYYVGRLDKDSEGLILLTNNGDISNEICRSRNNHEKEYVVTVNNVITDEFLANMAKGVPILDRVTKPCQIKRIGKYTFDIVITEGLNRQIRRMCEYFGYKVTRLRRIRVMNVELGALKVGEYVKLSDEELSLLLSLSDIDIKR